jgi:hypothetical protein
MKDLPGFVAAGALLFATFGIGVLVGRASMPTTRAVVRDPVHLQNEVEYLRQENDRLRRAQESTEDSKR